MENLKFFFIVFIALNSLAPSFLSTIGSGDLFFKQNNIIDLGTALAPPPNDTCLGAIQIPVSIGVSCTSTVAGTLVEATESSVAQTCFFSVDATFDNDVWFYFEAEESRQLIEISNLLGSTGDLIFEAFSGTCGSLSQIDCHDDPNDQFILAGLSINETYYLRIASFEESPQTTTFDICVRSAPSAPTNDECVAATVLNISSPACEATVNATLVGATESINPETCDFGVPLFNDIWFKFTASETNHELAISNIQNPPQELLYQFASGSCGSLTELACINSLDSSAPYNLVNLTIGIDYFVRISSYDAETQNTTFDICVKGTTSPCSLLVTNNSNSGTGSLRSAIECSQPGDTIRFDAAVFNQTIALDAPTIAVSHLLYIEAQTSDNITLSNADMNNTDILISIQDDLSISGLTIIGLTDQSMIIKIESGGGLVLLNTEIEKTTIDN